MDGEKRYILAPQGLHQGDRVENGPGADIRPGNALPLWSIPTGTVVHAIELRPGGGAKIARSAGAGVQLLAKEAGYAQLRMPSGEIRRVSAECRATVGEVGNAEQLDRRRAHPRGRGTLRVRIDRVIRAGDHEPARDRLPARPTASGSSSAFTATGRWLAPYRAASSTGTSAQNAE